MVKFAFTGSLPIALIGAVALNCPLPIPLSVAGPATATVASLSPTVSVALLTANVVSIVAPYAHTPTRTGRNIAIFRIIEAPQALRRFYNRAFP
jgi:hypothetical protein